MRRPKALAGALGVVLVGGALTSCQLIAGLGGIKPNDGSSSGQGGSAGSGMGGRGGSGGSGGEGAGAGAPPLCSELVTFGVSDQQVSVCGDAPGAAFAPTGEGYLGGCVVGPSAFGGGVCSNLSGCPFIQAINQQGKGGASVVLPAMGGVQLMGTAFVKTASGGAASVAISGIVPTNGSLTPPGSGIEITDPMSNTLYVARLSENFKTTLWQESGTTPDPNASLHVGADPDGQVVFAGNVANPTSFTWIPLCNSTGATTNGSDVFYGVLDGDSGGCIGALKLYQVAGDQSVELLRVGRSGHFLLTGRFTMGIDFGSAESATAASSAYFSYFNSTSGAIWDRIVGSTNSVDIPGGGISPDGSKLVVGGSFDGTTPDVLLPGNAAFGNCREHGVPLQGFVTSYGKIGTSNPSVGLAVCLGTSGNTVVTDAAIDDDGGVVVGAQTSGHVKFGTFDIEAPDGGAAVTFALKIDASGHLVWAAPARPTTGSSTSQILRINGVTSGFFASGVFAGDLDFGDDCQATAQGKLDVFLAHLGP